MIVDALDRAWRAWAELGRNLDAARWARPTRLEGWTVRHVFAHYADVPAMIGAALDAEDAVEPEAAPTFADAARLLAFMQRPGGIAHTAAERIRDAGVADSRSPAELVEQFTDVAPRTIARLRGQDLDRLVPYFGLGTVAGGEVLRIQLMEAVVHYLDLATALELPKPGPLAGEPMRETAALLTAVADPVHLVEAATGRGGAEVFPVLR
ncbi:maleylpyruvate isomerase N-terminal domain-containing protein [Saccharopolyspora sp. NFXS83]|uniref:maleylpyruvate isomerase N-terminal domain-containing protein n=1 Tax=Saccharopolyspora sp. NFXS83 TaxID=2993560 RepID=UPI00224A96BC|nr:maleylpyruvate isomerase N-terminal domain-containing protein [Saccharopolyspora sp. NFXS83]MCX2734015.1 maleylpyruvate isomerase N-terminal domain-containing protein [Saccharopolyspora sp. NFXS83]